MSTIYSGVYNFGPSDSSICAMLYFILVKLSMS